MRATANVVSNMNPTIGPSTYSRNGSVFAGSIGCSRMQSFMRFASAKKGRYSGEVSAFPPMLLKRITPFIFSSLIARCSSFNASSAESIGIEAKALKRVSKKDIRGRKRHDFNVDADAIHIFESLRDISHRRSYAKETCPAIGDNRLTGGTLVERKLRRKLANLVEIDGRIVMRVQIEFARHGSF